MSLIKKKDKLQKSRYEIIKTWLSSFVVTVAAVVAVVVFVPNSPEAKILKYTPLENQITYQVKVTDEDQALQEGTLKVVLENQMTYLEQSIPLGETSGKFLDLLPNTDYQLSIYGSKGFGLERLDSVWIKTEERVGGFILGYRLLVNDFEPNYEVDIVINDSENRYQSVLLYYGYAYDDQMFYDTIPITLSDQTVLIQSVYVKTHLYLEAMTVDGAIILDEMWLTPPFQMASSVYIDYRNRTEVGFNLYHEVNQDIEVTYIFELYQDDKQIASQQILGTFQSQDSPPIIFDDLKENSLYHVIVTAHYMNPDTLLPEEEIFEDIPFETLGYYEISYTMDTFDSYIEIMIEVIDPSHYFQIPYYEVYDLSGDFSSWISSEYLSFTPGANSKTVTMMIQLPDTGEIDIIVGIQNQNDFTMKHIVYHETLTKETYYNKSST
jgi:hypothetical protein